MEVKTAIKKQRLTTTMEETLTSPPLPTLSFDLIEEILYRLPVKSLIQFQCVCKSWKSLISDDPKFAKKHLHMSITSPRQSRHHLIVNFNCSSCNGKFWDSPISSVFEAATDDYIAQTKLCYPSILKFGSFKAVGSCHGILCIATQDYFVFWNPSVGQFNISQPPLDYYYNIIVYGFGYDHLIDNYKVVVVYCYDSESDSSDEDNGDDDEGFSKTQVMVHTLGTDGWRRIHEFPYSVIPFGEWGKFVGGAINWLASEDGSEFSYSFSIVSLDLGNESYQEILQPDYGEVNVVSLTLGVLRDCLCIFAHGESFIDVWIMKEYGKKESWNKLFTVPFIEDLGFYPVIKVAYIYEDEQVLLVSRDALKPKLVVYDYRSDTFKLPEIENIDAAIVPTVYVESLISPCGMQTLAVT
ncbi:F-box/kelch-repeat protein At3g23880-like [Cicer arietinum]|uniref:F-box/kelch-repeat protein At3g23880-like n=1 Tax=Cicer arietinum TaxID=3827 RepID=A0A1S2Y5N2_CICAR|nr:F-box/kelch-repeat protein At3g23880-like [Cicer arietinum]